MSEPPPSEPPPRSRGVIALKAENCTVCMICVQECPDWCITIEGHAEHVPATDAAEAEGAPNRRPRSTNVLDRFAIDFGLCMYCGICVDTCPFDALFWSPEYAYDTASGPTGLIAEEPRLGQWLGTVPEPVALDPGAASEAPPGSRRRGRI
jgi:NADH-quinone oxidoreductase subunit I